MALFQGSNYLGTVDADLIAAALEPAVLSGDAGNDVILGVTGTSYSLLYTGGGSIGTALNLDVGDWRTFENPLLFDNGATPFLSRFVRADAGSNEYFSIFLNAGSTLTVDWISAASRWSTPS